MDYYTTRELKALENIQHQLGNDNKPKWDTCLIELNRLKVTTLPRTFFWTNRLKTNRIPFHYGLDVEMGYKATKKWTDELLLTTMHPNQRYFLVKQILALYQLILKHTTDFNQGIYYFGCKRAFKDAKGTYWLVAQSSKVLQWDEHNNAATLLNWGHILGRYNGEPLITEIFINRQNAKLPKSNILSVQSEFKKFKVPTLLELGFTPKQQQVINLIAVGISKKMEASELKKMMATNMEISERSVSGHRANILKLGKNIFPLNSFETAVDVIRYLLAQDLVY